MEYYFHSPMCLYDRNMENVYSFNFPLCKDIIELKAASVSNLSTFLSCKPLLRIIYRVNLCHQYYLQFRGRGNAAPCSLLLPLNEVMNRTFISLRLRRPQLLK
jgi:hypothetical protein